MGLLTAFRMPRTECSRVACTRFRGHRVGYLMEPELGYGEAEVLHWSSSLTLCGSMRPTSPEATGKPRGTFVDAALTLDEITQRLIQVFVLLPRTATPATTCSASGHRACHDQPCKGSQRQTVRARVPNGAFAGITLDRHVGPPFPPSAQHTTSSKTAVRYP